MAQQTGESSQSHQMQSGHSISPSSSTVEMVPAIESQQTAVSRSHSHHNQYHQNNSNHNQLNHLARQSGVWRPWSQHQVAAAIAAQQHQQIHLVNQSQSAPSRRHSQQLGNQITATTRQHQAQQRSQHQANLGAANQHHDRQQNPAVEPIAGANHQSYLMNSLQTSQQQQRRLMLSQQQQPQNLNSLSTRTSDNITLAHQGSPSSTPPGASEMAPISGAHSASSDPQPLPLIQRTMQEQQLFNTLQLFRFIVAQFAQPDHH